MKHPSMLTLPLLVHLAAAGLLCAPAAAKPKNNRQQQQTQTQSQSQKAKAKPQSKPAAPAKTGAAKVNRTPGKTTGTAKTAQAAAPSKPAGASNGRKTNQNPSSKTPPPAMAARPAKRGLQTEGESHAPKNPAGSPSPLIVDPEELLARVPTSGPLNEEQLILLAIANSPVLERRRADIAHARAEKRKEEDWENPELRISYGSQDDDFIGDPYVERSIENFTETESYTGTDTTTSLAGAGELGFGESTTDVNTGTNTTTRYREIERIVRPRGNGREDIITNVYEVQTDTQNAIRDRTLELGGIVQQRRDAVAENVTRQLSSTSRDIRTSSEPDGATNSLAFLLRFQIPHKWERKARIERAAAEITLSEAQYLAEEDKLVREIRDFLEDLGTKERTVRALGKRRDAYTNYRLQMEKDAQSTGDGNMKPDTAVDISRARREMIDALGDAWELEADITRLREEIARFCGLRDPARIRTSGGVARRRVDVATLDISYLVDIAMLYRADAVESKGRLAIAKAYLAEADAKKIPWATFFDVSYQRQWRDGSSGSEDEWMARIGIELPIFEWTGINKRSKAYKEAAAAYEKQMEKQRQRVTTDIALAVDQLRKHSRALREREATTAAERRGMLADLEMVKKAGGDISDFARFKREEYSAQDAVQRLEMLEFEASSDYNKALMALENAIGVRIEKVLNGWRSSR